MGGLNTSLFVGMQALEATRGALEATSNNIANANTPGYTREVAQFSENPESVSSAGVGVFIDLYDRYEDRGGRIAFFGLKATVRRVLDLVGFMSFFGDFPEEAAALAHLNR